jgi:WD40 repeat protein
MTKKLTSDFWPSDVLDIIKEYLLRPKIIAASGMSINIWYSGVITKKIIGHTNTITVVSLSPNGKYIASGDVDGNVKIWDSITGNCENSMKNWTKIKCLAWCPKSTYLASCSGNRVIVWNALEGTMCQSILSDVPNIVDEDDDYRQYVNEVLSVSWSPDGEQIATCNLDETVHILNFKRGFCEKKFIKFSPIYFLGEPLRNILVWTLKNNCPVSWSPNYSKIASSINEGVIHLWDTISGKCSKRLGHINLVCSFAWSPNGTHLASVCYDISRIFIWNTESGICEKTIEYDEHLRKVAWSSNGRHIVSCSYTSIQMWDALTFVLVHKMLNKYCDNFSVE